MIDPAADLAAILAAPDFAKSFRRIRPLAEPVDVRMIVGTVDEEALQRYALSCVRKALFAAGSDVRVDDEILALEAVDINIPEGTMLKVLDIPQRVNDGLEVEALLGSATP